MSFNLQVTKVVNEVYHMYNRHQYPFVALNIAVASGKKILLYQNTVFEMHSWRFVQFEFCYFRLCGCERHPRQTTDSTSGGEAVAGYSKDLSHQHV